MNLIHRWFFLLLHFSGLNRLFFWLNRHRQIILTYHNVIPDALFTESLQMDLSHSASVFNFQIGLLRARFPITTEFGVAGSFMITFDDGFRNNLMTAAPILARHGVKACFFVCINSVFNGKTLLIDRLIMWVSNAPSGSYWIGPLHILLDDTDSRRMAWGQLYHHLLGHYGDFAALIDQMNAQHPFDMLPIPDALCLERFTPMNREQVAELATMGHAIGCHTRDHPILSKLSNDQIETELRACEPYLDDLFNTGLFSYPFGGEQEVSGAAIDACRRSRFSGGVLNTEHPSEVLYDPVYGVPRQSLPNNTNTYELAAKLSGSERFIKRLLRYA